MDTKCVNVKCNKYAVYNNPGSSTKLYCNDHKMKGMINLNMKKCEEPGCKQKASYNALGEKTKKYCNKHKLDGMVIIKTNLCLDCNKVARFGSDNKKVYCGEHKKPGMKNLTVPRCIHSKCDKYPNFNFANEKKPIYCAMHRLPMMVDIRTRKCENCNTIAGYNYPGIKQGRFCIKHKLPDMIPTKFIKCAECNNQAFYSQPIKNDSGIKYPKPTHCIEHKLPGMVNKNNVKQHCIQEGCRTVAGYGYLNEGKCLYCAEHKLKSMINLSNKRCKSAGCLKRPTFGYEAQGKRIYCELHKLPNMINVNIIKCIVADCNFGASFNYPGQKKPIYCATHSLCDMINLAYRPPKLYDSNNYKITILKYNGSILSNKMELDSVRLYNYLISQYENKHNKFVIYHMSHEYKKDIVDPFLMYPLENTMLIEDKPVKSVSEMLFGPIKKNQEDIEYIEPWDGITKVVIYLDTQDFVYRSKKDVTLSKHKKEDISPEIADNISKYHMHDVPIVLNIGNTKQKVSNHKFFESYFHKLALIINTELGLITPETYHTNKNPIKINY